MQREFPCQPGCFVSRHARSVDELSISTIVSFHPGSRHINNAWAVLP